MVIPRIIVERRCPVSSVPVRASYIPGIVIPGIIIPRIVEPGIVEGKSPGAIIPRTAVCAPPGIVPRAGPVIIVVNDIHGKCNVSIVKLAKTAFISFVVGKVVYRIVCSDLVDMDRISFCVPRSLAGGEHIVFNGGYFCCGLSGSHHPYPVRLVVDAIVIQRRRIVAIRATRAEHQRC